MDASMPLLFAAVIGFSHAFEADHLAAVSSIVTRRDKVLLALKDGAYWGLGHTSTILLIGGIMIIGKATFLNGAFGYFEAGVGGMLILLGLVRLRPLWTNAEPHHHHVADAKSGHQLAYGVGLIHGLAGSGTLILLVMTEIQEPLTGLAYLLIFGLGSVLGMLTVASVFGLPFAKRMGASPLVRKGLVVLSSVLCIGYGGWVVYQNLVG